MEFYLNKLRIITWKVKSQKALRTVPPVRCWMHFPDKGSYVKMTDRGWKEAPEGGDVYVHIADSLHWTAETNTTL